MSDNKNNNIKSAANICYSIMFFGILAFVGYITFIASNVILF